MASRCKTGWRIRLDRHTGRWEAYCNVNGPDYQQFATWRRALAYVQATLYGRHAAGSFPWPMLTIQAPRHAADHDSPPEDPCWTLTLRGWLESMGLSGPVAEVLNPTFPGVASG